jgi:hypothetical protein
MRKEEFYVGQRVKHQHPDTGHNIYGFVKEIKDTAIVIDWNIDDGIMKDVEHYDYEWDSIKDGNPTN